MPKATAVDGGHGVLTDHSIPRRAQRVGFAQAAAWKLIPFSGGPPSDRDLGLAYAEVFLRVGDSRQAVQAIGLLVNRGLDPPAMVRLAVLYQRMDKPDRALGLYRKVLEADPDNYFALANLAMIVASRGGLVEAVPMWKRALLHTPCSEEIGANLATALRALGEHAEAAALARAQQSCRFP
jgi:Flp pilus assembly protein TadD